MRCPTELNQHKFISNYFASFNGSYGIIIINCSLNQTKSNCSFGTQHKTTFGIKCFHQMNFPILFPLPDFLRRINVRSTQRRFWNKNYLKFNIIENQMNHIRTTQQSSSSLTNNIEKCSSVRRTRRVNSFSYK